MPRNEFMNHPGEEGEGDDASPEATPVEEPQEKVFDNIPLARLRMMSGLSTTKAHIAEIQAKSESPVSD